MAPTSRRPCAPEAGYPLESGRGAEQAARLEAVAQGLQSGAPVGQGQRQGFVSAGRGARRPRARGRGRGGSVAGAGAGAAEQGRAAAAPRAQKGHEEEAEAEEGASFINGGRGRFAPVAVAEEAAELKRMEADYHAANAAIRAPVWKSTSAPGAPDNSSLSHFSAMTAVLARSSGENRHRHAIEQASRRWRGGRRDDSARTRVGTISTQAPRGRRTRRRRRRPRRHLPRRTWRSRRPSPRRSACRSRPSTRTTSSAWTATATRRARTSSGPSRRT